MSPILCIEMPNVKTKRCGFRIRLSALLAKFISHFCNARITFTATSSISYISLSLVSMLFLFIFLSNKTSESLRIWISSVRLIIK